MTEFYEKRRRLGLRWPFGSASSTAMMGYHFTERVRRSLAQARQEAAKLNHEYVGTEHLLLGLIAFDDSVAAHMLQSAGVDTAQLRNRVTQIVTPGGSTRNPAAPPDLPYTTRAKHVLELAMSEARELKYTYVGTGQLLLGIAREERGIGAQVLLDAGFKLESAREDLRRISPPEEHSPTADGGVSLSSQGLVAMSSSPGRMLLAVSAVLAWAIGAMLIFDAPSFEATMLITLDEKTATIAQAQGAILLGLGFINWLMRGVTERRALGAVFYGNLVVQVVSFAVVLRALVRGYIPPSGAAAAVMHVALGAAFAWELMRLRRAK